MAKQEWTRVRRSKIDKLTHERNHFKRDLSFAENKIISRDNMIKSLKKEIQELRNQKEPTIWELILRKLK